MAPKVLLQILNFASVLASGLMIWKGLGLITNTESPIVVVLRHASFPLVSLANNSILVLSGSMEPAFYRGDLLFLTNPVHERYHTGDITVYKIPGADIPIVHRVLETHDAKYRCADIFLHFPHILTVSQRTASRAQSTTIDQR